MSTFTEEFADDQLPAEGDVSSWWWEPLSSLEGPRELPRLVRVPETSDIVIVGGGSELLSTSSNTTEVYSQDTGEWRPGGKLSFPHRDAEALVVERHGILVVGGSEGATKTGSRNVELLPVGSESWETVSPLHEARIAHAACRLPGDRVLVAGGQSDPDTFLDSVEIYDPSDGTWTVVSPMSEVRATHHLRPLPDGRVIAVGGGTDITATRSAEIYDPESDTWSPTDGMRECRWGFASAVVDELGGLVVAGGRVPAQKGASIALDLMTIHASVEKFDFATERWTSLPSMNVPRTMGIPNVELARLPNGGLLFPGGRTYPAPYHGTTSAEYLDPASGAWTMLAPMRAGASYHAFTTLDNGQVLTAGGRGARFLPLRRTEKFAGPGVS